MTTWRVTRRGVRVVGSLLGWGLLLTASAEAATYYVATNGDDANLCTLSAPCRTINHGASLLTPGDTLYVRAGTYAESLVDAFRNGTSWSNAVTLAVYPGETVVLSPGGGHDYAIYVGPSHSYIVIEGLVIDGTDLGSNTIQLEGADHIRLKNVEVKNSVYSGVWVSGSANEFIGLQSHDNGFTVYEGNGYCWYGIYMHGNSHVIEHSSFHHNGGYGIHIYDNVGGNDDIIVRNNVIYENGHCGVGGRGIVYDSGSGGLIYNNVIWGNATGGITVDYRAFNTKVYNNTVVNNPDLGIYIGSGSSSAEVSNNIVYQNGSSIDNDGSGTTITNNWVDQDPKFLNPSAQDFHLTLPSPAIDAGLTLPEVTIDFDGVSRPQGASHDIGAYEYRATTLLPGDLDGNGQRDLADVRLIIYMLLGQQATTPEAELTGDGAVTLADVQALIRLIIGVP